MCCDGTWNRPSADDDGETNVQRMYKWTKEGRVDDQWEQITFYDSGVGSSTYDKKDQLLGGVTGKGIDQNIMDAYTFICMNYCPGDELYFFGFSRGAYTARSLVGLIRNCGILLYNNISLVPKAYELYRNRNDYARPDSSMMIGFKKRYTHYSAEGETKIKMIGVWDTVGSLGIPLPFFTNHNLAKYKFHDVTLSSFVDNAYHALAVDELRKPFQPSLWELSNTVKNDKSHPQQLEQRWFIGAHSNVGGGYSQCTLRNATLQWISGKAQALGLQMNANEIEVLQTNYKQAPAKSLSFFYKLLGVYWREISPGSANDPGKKRETIDETVKKRWQEDTSYRPKNLGTKVTDLKW